MVHSTGYAREIPLQSKSVRVYTDGSCSNNGRDGAKASYGVFYGDNDPRNASGSVSGAQTNNRAELSGAIHALKSAPKDAHVTVCADSEYVVRGVKEWMPTWKSNNWKTSTRAPVKNQDLWRELDGLREQRQGNVTFEHVRGHQGIYGNEKADSIARNH